MNDALEQDIYQLDDALDILQGWDKDVFHPDQYSSERLHKGLREKLRAVEDIIKSHRELMVGILESKPALKAVGEMAVSA